jgi:hypothetical protein
MTALSFPSTQQPASLSIAFREKKGLRVYAAAATPISAQTVSRYRGARLQAGLWPGAHGDSTPAVR